MEYSVRLGKANQMLNNPKSAGEKLITDIIFFVEDRVGQLSNQEILEINLPVKNLVGMIISNLIVNLCTHSLAEDLTPSVRLQEMKEFMSATTTVVLDCFQKIETYRTPPVLAN